MITDQLVYISANTKLLLMGQSRSMIYGEVIDLQSSDQKEK